MSTLVEITNRSIEDLGHDPIVGFDDGTETSDLAKQYHLLALDYILRRIRPHFAKIRAKPSAATGTPLFEWAFHFDYPNDPHLVKLLGVFEGDRKLLSVEYTTEGRKILCDITPINVKYIGRIVDPNKYDPGFEEAYQAKLAAMLAIPLTGNRDLRKDMEALARDFIQVAIAEGEEEEGIEETTYDGIVSALDE